MKYANSHLSRANFLGKYTAIPKNPKIVLLSSPNINAELFAYRMAIDLGVPALSIKKLYKTILAFEHNYSKDAFYRRVIKILKNPDQKEAISQLENEMIPEKLITLTKYTELGYVLYDYPNNLFQAQNLEQNSNGGINLVMNLMLKKEAAKERDAGRHQCQNCERVYYKNEVLFKNESINLSSYYPENNVCTDCGSHDIKKISDDAVFESRYDAYERQLFDLAPFYQTLGLLVNFEVKKGLDDYGKIRTAIVDNIKH